MSEILVHVTRGPLVESIHRGDIVVVHKNGEILKSLGDPYKKTFIRSAGKPLQTLNVILSGAADQYDFSDKELSIMCASHYGEAFHRDTIVGIMKKLNLPLDSLLCGSTLSIKPEYARELLSSHFELGPYNNDCSGKHTGMIATCLIQDYPITNYPNEQHPVQQDILRVIAEICDYEQENIALGIDGCGVPVHGMPLYHMALGYAKLANPNTLRPELQQACLRVFKAMNTSPEMVAGTDGFCTELIKSTNGKLVGKLGAEGIYCIGFKDLDIGMAIKIEDGNYSRALSPVVMQCLEDLEILTHQELKSLEHFKEFDHLNNMGTIVGKVTPVFKLK